MVRYILLIILPPLPEDIQIKSDTGLCQLNTCWVYFCYDLLGSRLCFVRSSCVGRISIVSLRLLRKSLVQQPDLPPSCCLIKRLQGTLECTDLYMLRERGNEVRELPVFQLSACDIGNLDSIF